ncbi:hypothetical protein [Acidithiobacillus sp.]|jgi:hypothetical protein|uniref:hypothetical protein n=1 Tax=Acidithiobacillus sp. TaxID=1872118 RepID=UPI0025B8817D|nr:hypothetical protein [Acidithiobacillus sp.]MCK9188380.1 hypothetical protein [Acidithiobacillus sp.]MCK9358801.1 hypothetical protein [Acidithiobacillus sp.]
MLIATGNAYGKYLDFADAEVGDRFWVVEHVPYSGTVTALRAYTVAEIRSKTVLCRAEDGKPLKLKRALPQENCYLDADPYFQNISRTWQMNTQVQAAKQLVKEHETIDFDQEVIDAIMAWRRRLLARKIAAQG